MTNATGTAIDFEIKRKKLLTEDGQMTNRVAICRTDTDDILGIVSESYNEIEHRKAYNAAVSALTKVGGFTMKNLEVSSNGARMYAHFENENEYAVKQGDLLRPTLIVTNSLDGCLKFGFQIGAFRLVCSNGLIAGFSALNISVKHTANIDIDEVAHRGEDAMNLFSSKILPMWGEMARTNVPTKYAIDEMLVKKNIIPQKITERAAELAGNNPETTVWDLYNHYTYHLTHEYTGSVDRRMELSTTIAKVIMKKFIKGS